MYRVMDRVSECGCSVRAVRFERLRMETSRKEPDKVRLGWVGQHTMMLRITTVAISKPSFQHRLSLSSLAEPEATVKRQT